MNPERVGSLKTLLVEAITPNCDFLTDGDRYIRLTQCFQTVTPVADLLLNITEDFDDGEDKLHKRNYRQLKSLGGLQAHSKSHTSDSEDGLVL